MVIETNLTREFPDALVLADKPPGITSADLVKKLVRIVGRKTPVGHTGTLDKFATGLMVLLTGRATSFAQIFLDHPKSYEAGFFFGRSTDTFDPEGQETAAAPAAEAAELLADRDKLTHALDVVQRRGTQVPPEFSALKMGGRRSSDLVREGKAVELEPRHVEISEAVFLRSQGQVGFFRFHVSAGTYIRAIARDLGIELGFPVFVQSLRRLSVGSLTIEDARVWQPDRGEPRFTDIREGLDWPVIRVLEPDVPRVISGQRLRLNPVPEGSFLLVRPDERLLAWAEGREGRYSYRRVFV